MSHEPMALPPRMGSPSSVHRSMAKWNPGLRRPPATPGGSPDYLCMWYNDLHVRLATRGDKVIRPPWDGLPSQHGYSRDFERNIVSPGYIVWSFTLRRLP
ncbi:hypothetical protein VTK73DRAFT_3438 [Phialemonium thermophilum]|uniref:Uncharacterized protein n=1 Tax=Phialemonium thermophilum TaxID=223376 RepID=A0ABR3VIF2_9PEZI